MRLLLSTYGSRGDDAAFVWLRELGAEMHYPVTSAAPPSAAELTARAAELLATRFDTASGAWR
jgi:hypothetical protein